MAFSARDAGKQAVDEQTDPGYSDEGEPVTLYELYEAVAELRGLVMVLAEPVILRLQAKEASTAKRLAASDAENSFPSTVLGYFKLLSYNAPVVAEASAPARQWSSTPWPPPLRPPPPRRQQSMRTAV